MLKSLRIERDEDNTLEIAQNTNGQGDALGIVIEVTDFGGSLDNPWQSASITLSHDEAKRVRDYLNSVYPA